MSELKNAINNKTEKNTLQSTLQGAEVPAVSSEDKKSKQFAQLLADNPDFDMKKALQNQVLADVKDPAIVKGRQAIESEYKAAYDKYLKDQNKTEWMRAAEKLGNALLQLGAGAYGLKNKVDMSGVKFDKTDWENKFNRNLDELKLARQSREEQLGQVGAKETSIISNLAKLREMEQAEQPAVDTSLNKLEEAKLNLQKEKLALEKAKLEEKKKDRSLTELEKRKLDIAKQKLELMKQPKALDPLKLKKQELEIKKLEREMDKPVLNKADEIVDKEFAKNYGEMLANPAQLAGASKNIEQVEYVLDKLGQNAELSGGLVQRLPEFMRSFVDREGLDVQQTIEQVVQQDLRQTLGAQFTEKEGDKLIKRAYNKDLPVSYNLTRVRRLAKQMKEAANNRKEAIKYFKEKGTLKGFEKPLFRKADDFNLEEDTDTSEKLKRLEYLRKKKAGK